MSKNRSSLLLLSVLFWLSGAVAEQHQTKYRERETARRIRVVLSGEDHLRSYKDTAALLKSALTGRETVAIEGASSAIGLKHLTSGYDLFQEDWSPSSRLLPLESETSEALQFLYLRRTYLAVGATSQNKASRELAMYISLRMICGNMRNPMFARLWKETMSDRSWIKSSRATRWMVEANKRLATSADAEGAENILSFMETGINAEFCEKRRTREIESYQSRRSVETEFTARGSALASPEAFLYLLLGMDNIANRFVNQVTQNPPEIPLPPEVNLLREFYLSDATDPKDKEKFAPLLNEVMLKWRDRVFAHRINQLSASMPPDQGQLTVRMGDQHLPGTAAAIKVLSGDRLDVVSSPFSMTDYVYSEMAMWAKSMDIAPASTGGRKQNYFVGALGGWISHDDAIKAFEKLYELTENEDYGRLVKKLKTR